MNPWEGVGSFMGQALGMGLGAQRQEVDYVQRAYGAGMAYPYSKHNYLPINDPVKVEEPPDEFTQLSNHKFHELLDRFKELT